MTWALQNFLLVCFGFDQEKHVIVDICSANIFELGHGLVGNTEVKQKHSSGILVFVGHRVPGS